MQYSLPQAPMAIAKFTAFQTRTPARLSKARSWTLLCPRAEYIEHCNDSAAGRNSFFSWSSGSVAPPERALHDERHHSYAPMHQRNPATEIRSGRRSIQVTLMIETRTKPLGSTDTLHERQGTPKSAAYMSRGSSSSQSFCLHSVTRKPQ